MAHVHLTCPPKDQELLWSLEVGLFFSPKNMKNGVCTMGLKKFWTSRLILLCHDFIDVMKGHLFWSQIRTKSKGQLDSEWIYEIIVCPKMQTKNYKDFCPTKQIRFEAKKSAYNHQKITKTKCYNPCLFGRAETLVIFGLHCWRNDDLINSFWV